MDLINNNPFDDDSPLAHQNQHFPNQFPNQTEEDDMLSPWSHQMSPKLNTSVTKSPKSTPKGLNITKKSSGRAVRSPQERFSQRNPPEYQRPIAKLNRQMMASVTTAQQNSQSHSQEQIFENETLKSIIKEQQEQESPTQKNQAQYYVPVEFNDIRNLQFSARAIQSPKKYQNISKLIENDEYYNMASDTIHESEEKEKKMLISPSYKPKAESHQVSSLDSKNDSAGPGHISPQNHRLMTAPSNAKRGQAIFTSGIYNPKMVSQPKKTNHQNDDYHIKGTKVDFAQQTAEPVEINGEEAPPSEYDDNDRRRMTYQESYKQYVERTFVPHPDDQVLLMRRYSSEFDSSDSRPMVLPARYEGSPYTNLSQYNPSSQRPKSGRSELRVLRQGSKTQRSVENLDVVSGKKLQVNDNKEKYSALYIKERLEKISNVLEKSSYKNKDKEAKKMVADKQAMQAEDNQKRVKLLKRINNNIAAYQGHQPAIMQKIQSVKNLSNISGDEKKLQSSSFTMKRIQSPKTKSHIRPTSPKNYVFPTFGNTYSHFLPNHYNRKIKEDPLQKLMDNHTKKLRNGVQQQSLTENPELNNTETSEQGATTTTTTKKNTFARLNPSKKRTSETLSNNNDSQQQLQSLKQTSQPKQPEYIQPKMVHSRTELNLKNPKKPSSTIDTDLVYIDQKNQPISSPLRNRVISFKKANSKTPQISSPKNRPNIEAPVSPKEYQLDDRSSKYATPSREQQRGSQYELAYEPSDFKMSKEGSFTEEGTPLKQRFVLADSIKSPSTNSYGVLTPQYQHPKSAQLIRNMKYESKGRKIKRPQVAAEAAKLQGMKLKKVARHLYQ